MRHARIERWSLGNSAIHKRHAAAKILTALVMLICIATLQPRTEITCLLYFAVLMVTCATAGLPVPPVMRSAAAVLPFALCFAIVSALAGEPERALWMLIRAWLSALTALLLIATTPMPSLIAGLEFLHAPRFLLQVMAFLYRYLVVLMEEAGAMRQAGAARAGSIATLRFRQAASAAGVLFARAYARAQAIHRAMISRGFEGRLPVFARPAFAMADAGFVALGAAVVIAIRVMNR